MIRMIEMKNELLAVKALREYQNKLRDNLDILHATQSTEDEVKKVAIQISDIRNAIDVLESAYRLHVSSAVMAHGDVE